MFSKSRIDAFSEFVIRFRWFILPICIILSLGAASGAPKLQFISHYSIFFGPDNPDLKKWDNFQSEFSKNDNINFVLQIPGTPAFDQSVARVVADLTDRAWSIPNARRVDSYTNYQYVTSTDDGLTLRDFIEDPEALSEAEFAAREAYAVDEPGIFKYLVSEDLMTTSVNVNMHFVDGDNDGLNQSVAAARAIADDIRATYPDVTLVLTGVAMFNNAFNESGESDGATLIPAMYLIILILCLVFLRSIYGMLVTLFTIILSTIVAMGLAGHLGMALAPVTIIAPNIILTLAVADCMHIVNSMRRGMRDGLDKQSALKQALSKNFLALFVTSATTAIGFLSLNYSDSPPFQYLGNITAIGIVAAWILSITFVPAFLSVVPMRAMAHRKPSRIQGLVASVAETGLAMRKQILIGGGVFSVVMMGLAFTNDLDDRFSQYFSERMPFRQHLDFASQELRGVDFYEYAMESGEEGGIANVEYLQTLDAFASWLRAQPEVQHVAAFTDQMKRINQNMNGGGLDQYRLPQDSAEAAQYLLLYELSLPYGLDLNDQINIERSASRLTVSLYDMRVGQQHEFEARAQGWLAENAPDTMQATPTGTTVIMGMLSHRNIEAMLIGNLVAIVCISILVSLMLRNAVIGVLAVVANLVPVMITFGIWALLAGYVGYAASVIGAVSLGIVVDFNVHLMARYLDAVRERGQSKAQAIRTAISEVGDTLFYTAIIVALGFAVLAFSTFQVNAQLGLLTAITILVAFVFDLFMLPALLLLGAEEDRAEPETQASSLT